MPKVVLAFNSLDQAIGVFSLTPPYESSTRERRGAALGYLAKLAYNKADDPALVKQIKGVLKQVMLGSDVEFAMLILPELSRSRILYMGAEIAADVLEANPPVAQLLAQCGLVVAMYDGKNTDNGVLTEGAYATRLGKSPYYKAGLVEKKIVNDVYGRPGPNVGKVDGVNFFLLNHRSDELDADIQGDAVVIGALKEMFTLDSYDDIMMTNWGWPDAASVEEGQDRHPYWAVLHLMNEFPSIQDPKMIEMFMQKSLDRPDVRKALMTGMVKNFAEGKYENMDPRQGTINYTEEFNVFYRGLLQSIAQYGKANCLDDNDSVFNLLLAFPKKLGKNLIDQLLAGYSWGDCTDEDVLASLRDRFHTAQNDDDALQYFIANAARFQQKIKQFIADSSNAEMQIKAIKQGLPAVYQYYSQDELGQLWAAVPHQAQLAILETIGNKWPKNTLLTLQRGQDKQMADIATRLLGTNAPPAPAAIPPPDIEASKMTRTVIAAISDMSDALRKMKSPDNQTAWEAAEFLMEVDTPDARESLRAYLFSPRYQATVGQMILKRARKAFGDQYTEIAAQVLWANHPDKVLTLQAAEIVGSSARTLPPDLANKPAVKAVRGLKEWWDVQLSESPEKREAAQTNLGNLINSPETRRALKDMFSLPNSVDVLAGSYQQYGNPSWLMEELLAKYPEQSDVVMIKNYLDKPRPQVGRLMSAYAQGLKALAPQMKNKGLYDAVATDMLREAAKKFIMGLAKDDGNFLFALPNSYSVQFLDAYEKTPQAAGYENLIEETREKVFLQTASVEQKVETYKQNPTKYEKEIGALLWNPAKGQADAIRQLLPYVYANMDQGSIAKLWEEAGMDSRLAILETVGNRWPVNALVALANGNDAVAGAAAKILAERQQSHLVPRHMREPEL